MRLLAHGLRYVSTPVIFGELAFLEELFSLDGTRVWYWTVICIIVEEFLPQGRDGNWRILSLAALQFLGTLRSRQSRLVPDIWVLVVVLLVVFDVPALLGDLLSLGNTTMQGETGVQIPVAHGPEI